MLQGSLSLDDWISESANDSMLAWRWNSYSCASRMSVWQSFQNSLAHLGLKMTNYSQFHWTIKIFPRDMTFCGVYMVYLNKHTPISDPKMDWCQSWLPQRNWAIVTCGSRYSSPPGPVACYRTWKPLKGRKVSVRMGPWPIWRLNLFLLGFVS